MTTSSLHGLTSATPSPRPATAFTCTDDVRVADIRVLTSPAQLQHAFPLRPDVAAQVAGSRRAIHDILHNRSDRLVVVVGPCSIHDPQAALEYAQRLLAVRQRHAADLEIVMRVYFEKPRTTVGWKGLINDPGMDDSFDINRGLRTARALLVALNEMGVPAGTEFLDPISPQYVSDLITWAAIGARTTESQVHRELASGVSCPIGFKNGTEGKLKVAVDAMMAAQRRHCFLGVTKEGVSAIVETRGNDDCHVILRGGAQQPNYDAASVASAGEQLTRAGVTPRLMIDCSHDNSRKQHRNQIGVAAEIGQQLRQGESRIFGVMIESHLVEGRQDIPAGGGMAGLTYGQSVTDACLGWDDTVSAIDGLAEAVRERRRVLAHSAVALPAMS